MSKVSFLLWSSCQTVAAEWLMACFQHFHPHTHEKFYFRLFLLLPGMKNLSELPVFDISTDISLFFGVKKLIIQTKGTKTISVREEKADNTSIETVWCDRSIEDWWEVSLIYINLILVCFSTWKINYGWRFRRQSDGGRNFNEGKLVSLFNYIFNILSLRFLLEIYWLEFKRFVDGFWVFFFTLFSGKLI